MKCLVAAKEVSIKICRAPLLQQIDDLRGCLNTKEEYMAEQLQKLGMTKQESQFHSSMILGDMAKLQEVGLLAKKPAPRRSQKPALHWIETRGSEPKPKASQRAPKTKEDAQRENIRALYTRSAQV